MALPIVLGVLLVLVAIATGVALQVRSELKAGALEQDVAQAQVLIWSGLQQAVREAANHPDTFAATKPDPAAGVPAGYTACTPAPVGIAPVADMDALGSPTPRPNPTTDPDGPAYCVDVLQRHSASIAFDGTGTGNKTVQVPVVVRYRVHPADPVRTAYAWVVMIPTVSKTGTITGWPTIAVYYNHQWCTPKNPWNGFDFCEQGG